LGVPKHDRHREAAGLVLAALCEMGNGFYADFFNPSLAFLAMLMIGLAHGLHPELTAAHSLRSSLGSVMASVWPDSAIPHFLPASASV